MAIFYVFLLNVHLVPPIIYSSFELTSDVFTLHVYASCEHKMTLIKLPKLTVSYMESSQKSMCGQLLTARCRLPCLSIHGLSSWLALPIPVRVQRRVSLVSVEQRRPHSLWDSFCLVNITRCSSGSCCRPPV